MVRRRKALESTTKGNGATIHWSSRWPKPKRFCTWWIEVAIARAMNTRHSALTSPSSNANVQAFARSSCAATRTFLQLCIWIAGTAQVLSSSWALTPGKICAKSQIIYRKTLGNRLIETQRRILKRLSVRSDRTSKNKLLLLTVMKTKSFEQKATPNLNTVP